MANSLATPPMLRRANWWSRNWKWFVPVLCAGAIAIFAAFIALVVGLVFGAIKSSDAYKIPVETAKADSRVIDALGSPVKERFFVSGKINVSGPSGEANLAIPIAGPRGKGTIYVEGTKSVGKWHFRNLVFQAKREFREDRLEGEGIARQLVINKRGWWPEPRNPLESSCEARIFWYGLQPFHQGGGPGGLGGTASNWSYECRISSHNNK